MKKPRRRTVVVEFGHCIECDEPVEKGECHRIRSMQSATWNKDGLVADLRLCFGCAKKYTPWDGVHDRFDRAVRRLERVLKAMPGGYEGDPPVEIDPRVVLPAAVRRKGER